jgi:hypothetical protein
MMNRGAVDLSAIVVNWNGGDLLRSCLRSLVAATANMKGEIWLVDNASSDGSAESAMSSFPEAQVIRNSRNEGFARAVNAALSEAAGDFTLLLNPDAQISAASLHCLLDVMRADATIGIAGCPSVDAEGRGAPGYETSFPGARRKAIAAAEERVRDAAWVSGACLVARRKMVDEIGPFDPGYFMYYEDVDWCYRARARGWRVVSVSDASVQHELGGSSGQVNPAERAGRVASSRLRFYRKHYSANRARLLALRIASAAALGILLRLAPSPLGHGARSALQTDWARLRVALAGFLARKVDGK